MFDLFDSCRNTLSHLFWSLLLTSPSFPLSQLDPLFISICLFSFLWFMVRSYTGVSLILLWQFRPVSSFQNLCLWAFPKFRFDLKGIWLVLYIKGGGVVKVEICGLYNIWQFHFGFLLNGVCLIVIFYFNKF